MPRRSNLFQKVVRILHETVAGEASVEESALLIDSDTDTEREVDVLVRTTVASHAVLIGVEATASGRTADVTWVEGQLQKHSTLPTDKLVLVSEAGFSEPARKKAEANGAVPLAPEDVPDGFDAGRVVNKLGSIYPKLISLDLLEVVATCKSPAGAEEELEPPVGAHVFYENGELFATIKDIAAFLFNQRFTQIAEEVNLANVVKDLEKEMTLDLAGPFSHNRELGDGTSEAAQLYLNPQSDGISLGLWLIQHVRIKGKMRIEVGEIPLSHKRLSGVSDGFSFGEGKVGDTAATFVMNETQAGAKGRLILETKDGLLEGELHPAPDPGTLPETSAPNQERPRLDSNQRPSD